MCFTLAAGQSRKLQGSDTDWFWFRAVTANCYCIIRLLVHSSGACEALLLEKLVSIYTRWNILLQGSDMAPAAALNHKQPERWWSKDTVAVVTGSNKGLGQGIVLHLARHGITVVSTARDSQLGAAAVDSVVKAEPELAGLIHFHQLDITDEHSVIELAAWLQSTFDGIDILINNAGISKHRLEVYDDAVETFEANYFGTKRVTEKLLPLLRASPNGARIVMISSSRGQIEKFASNEYAKGKVQEAVDHLDKSIVDSLAAKYLEDVKGGRSIEEKWGTERHHYKESKLFLNTYTRILAGEQSARPEGQRILVNVMCPGAVLTDMAKEALAKLEPAVVEQMIAQYGMHPPTEAAIAPVWIALLPKDDFPHDQYFLKQQASIW